MPQDTHRCAVYQLLDHVSCCLSLFRSSTQIAHSVRSTLLIFWSKLYPSTRLLLNFLDHITTFSNHYSDHWTRYKYLQKKRTLEITHGTFLSSDGTKQEVRYKYLQKKRKLEITHGTFLSSGGTKQEVRYKYLQKKRTLEITHGTFLSSGGTKQEVRRNRIDDNTSIPQKHNKLHNLTNFWNILYTNCLSSTQVIV